MNKIAAAPLMITTREYWLMESSIAGNCLAKTGARKPSSRSPRSDRCRRKRSKADQSQPSHPTTLSRIKAGKAQQHQQPSKRVNHICRDQPRLAGNNRRRGLATWGAAGSRSRDARQYRERRHLIIQEQHRDVHTRERRCRQSGGDDEVEAGLQAGLDHQESGQRPPGHPTSQSRQFEVSMWRRSGISRGGAVPIDDMTNSLKKV